MALDFHVLGPLEAVRDGRPLHLGGRRERALLALLLLRANEAVSRDVLVDRLWTRPPAGAVHALEARISELRKRLEEPVVRTTPAGYLLEVEPGHLDLQRFEELLAEGRRALAEGEAGRAYEVLTEALACWRGPPLADVAFEPVGLTEVGRLEEERLSAVEELVEARLVLGRHHELVAELDALVGSQPLRERLRGQLMLALYRSGRQAEALDAYAQGRRLLVEELGIEPGRPLQELQEAILRHDLELEPPPMEGSSATPTPFEPSQPTVAQRKVVTVLFCDVTDSTALGESFDPEALSAVLDRYFERMKAIVERHGGTVEKFIGDAVMAVFGVPRLHEDDALRACRAACEMRDALPELGIEARIGVATGEVLTGGVDKFATGAALNLAARLEQAAAPGEILVDVATERLVRALTLLEAVEPLALKGFRERRPAYRLVEAAATTPPRGMSAPFVGRETELRRLRDAFAQAVADGSCQLFTLLGPPGIGKSRIAAEFLAGLEARAVSGRCLSYGEGITYTPVVEIVEQLGERPADPDAAAAIAALLRESMQPTSPEAIAWAFRKTLEEAASGAPLVCVFEDLHWGETPLLDLVETVADLSRGAPILLLCLARPELHDRRPAWAGGKLNATTLLLPPLSDDESERLLAALGGGELAARGQIITAAEGNPLFLEEMASLARDGDAGELVVPESIHALLAARLDGLEPTERTLLERASVEGKVFERAALDALNADVGDIQALLVSLVRRDLIRPARSPLSGDAYAFRHQLIRDAAYEALPKAVRADLHRRVASWLGEHGSQLVELDELVGYHLEQVCRYECELGRTPDPALRAEAQRRLTAAGRGAFRRRDHQAAANLFGRAAAADPATLDVALEVDLTGSLFYSGNVPAALGRIEDDQVRAAEAGDERRALLLRLWLGILGRFVGGSLEALEATAAEARPVAEAAADDVGLLLVRLAGWFAAGARWDDGIVEMEGASEHARRAGLGHWDTVLIPSAWLSRYYGSTPAGEMLRWLEAEGSNGGFPAITRLQRAVVLAMLGRSEEAVAVLDQNLEEELSHVGVFARALAAGFVVDLQRLVGDVAGAAEYAERACALSEGTGERANYGGYLTQLADAQCRLGRLDEAETNLERATATGTIDRAQWCLTRGRIDLARGDVAGAATNIGEAAALLERTQSLALRADAHATLGEVRAVAGETTAARAELETALRLYEQKEHVVGARRVREQLAALTPASGS